MKNAKNAQEKKFENQLLIIGLVVMSLVLTVFYFLQENELHKLTTDYSVNEVSQGKVTSGDIVSSD
jgi:hypothetical protein